MKINMKLMFLFLIVPILLIGCGDDSNGTESTQGISMISPGRVISQTDPDEDSTVEPDS